MRRASAAMIQGLTVVGKKVSVFSSVIDWLSPIDSDGKRNILVAEDDVMNLPESVVTSHSMVSVNVGESHLRYSSKKLDVS